MTRAAKVLSADGGVKASRASFLPFLAALVLTGCYTYTQAPGAIGKVVDARTRAPVRGAEITRRSIAGGLNGRPLVPPEGLPSITVTTDRNGCFNLPPAVYTQIMFMYLHNPPSVSGSFIVTAPGYGTNEVEGSATSRSLWRADLGQVPLSKR